MIVTAVDSRGYTSSATVNVTVVKYEKINISSLVMRRINEVEPTCEVDIYGTFSPVTVSGGDKNFFQHLYVRYKKKRMYQAIRLGYQSMEWNQQAIAFLMA